MNRLLLSTAAASLLVIGTALAQEESWQAPRSMEMFQSLLDRSPFSLPTAEESSALAEKYGLGGAATIDGVPVVFLFDKTTQERHRVTTEPNAKSMSLVEFIPNPDPRKMKAVVRVGSETMTVSYSESSGSGAPAAAAAARPPRPVPTAVVNPPAPGDPGTVEPGAPGTAEQPVRRVIRRRVISGQPPTQ